MKPLTTPSEHGPGYSIDAEDLTKAIAKLGKIEHKAHDLIAEACDDYCVWVHLYEGTRDGQERLELKCERCPLSLLDNMI